eukprot:CAMPEP_0119545904 /NCGR_PEP_ID=MMETSP1352-20130426/520_1 /TAXON_ID=265584 /ORGANISM="Stauroneis constricta, Strain CCMP1120" /LENGTH=336 /DNA_ID=CAMNT_0007590523 /DNA_START=110 /DNA_END=1117 /DNA_ORIENTATION=+
MTSEISVTIPSGNEDGSTMESNYTIEVDSEQPSGAAACCTEVKSLGTELIDYSRQKPWKKKLLTVLVIASSVSVFTDLLFFGNIRQLLVKFVEWMAVHESAAVFAFIGLFVVATLIFIPPSFLFFGAGYAFAHATHSITGGIIAATFACFTGCFVGALLSFFRARYMMRDLIYLFSRRYPLVRAADKALKRNGFRIMLLLRLCPLIPFSALNYIGGVTGISWVEFGASIVGILPLLVLTVTMGATAGNIVSSNPTADQQLTLSIMMFAGVGFLIIAVIIAWRFAKKELESELEMDSAQMENYLHPEAAMEQDLTEAGIETQYNEETADDEEWFWIW